MFFPLGESTLLNMKKILWSRVEVKLGDVTKPSQWNSTASLCLTVNKAKGRAPRHSLVKGSVDILLHVDEEIQGIKLPVFKK